MTCGSLRQIDPRCMIAVNLDMVPEKMAAVATYSYAYSNDIVTSFPLSRRYAVEDHCRTIEKQGTQLLAFFFQARRAAKGKALSVSADHGAE